MDTYEEVNELYNYGRLIMLDSIVQDFYLTLRLNQYESMEDCVHRLGKFYALDTTDTCLNSIDNYIEKAGYYTSRINYEKS